MGSGSKFKLMAGLSNPYESWTRAETPVLENLALTEGRDSKEHLLSEFSRSRVAIKRLARFLEDDRYGGSHLPEFNSVHLEKLIEAVAAGGIGSEAAKHHIKAVQASKVAHGDKHKTADVAHASHKNASQLHRNAAMHLSQAGDTVTASAHEKWASHHDKVASHIAKAMPKPSPAKLPDTHKEPLEAPAQKQRKEPGPSHLSGELPAVKTPAKRPAADSPSSSGKKVLSVHKDPFQATPKRTDPSVTGRNSAASSPSAKAHNMSFAASALGKDKAVSHKELSGVHAKASKAHLKAAVHHFLRGDHDTALTHFNAGIHASRKSSQHTMAGMSQTHNPAPAGPRAATGRTNRPS